MKTPDFQFHVADPEIIAAPGATMLTLRFQKAEPFQLGHRRSGKYIHIDLTTAFAMQLLAALQAAKQELGLPEAPPPKKIFVPPAKDRN